jgi:hypothetical protein
MTGARYRKRAFIGEVPVDREALDSGQLCDGTDGGLSSTNRLVEGDCCLDNALASLLLMLSPLL